jgi:hypothetical protein
LRFVGGYIYINLENHKFINFYFTIEIIESKNVVPDFFAWSNNVGPRPMTSESETSMVIEKRLRSLDVTTWQVVMSIEKEKAPWAEFEIVEEILLNYWAVIPI